MQCAPQHQLWQTCSCIQHLMMTCTARQMVGVRGISMIAMLCYVLRCMMATAAVRWLGMQLSTCPP